MQRILFGTVAAVVLSAGSAMAAQWTINYDTTCEVQTITSQGKGVASLAESDSCDNIFGVGGIVKITTGSSAKTAVIGSYSTNYTGTLFNYELQWPLKTGGTWNLYYSTDGINFTYCCTGTYTILKDPNERFPGLKSVTDSARD